MAYLFNTPDFYGMMENSRNRTSDNFDNLQQLILAYPRYKQAEAAIEKENRRDKRLETAEQENSDLRRKYFEYIMGGGRDPSALTVAPGASEPSADPLTSQQLSDFDLMAMGLNPALMNLRG